MQSDVQLFSEEERSKQPSAFTVIRDLLHTFSSDEDEHLGLYGAFGYDLVFQFEPIPQRHLLDACSCRVVLPAPG